MKRLRFILTLGLLLLLFNNTPAYADGGIPLWIYTASTAAYSAFTIQGIGNFSFLLGTVFLLYVIFVEVLIFKFLDKDKQFKLKQIICSVTVANIFSVIAGIIITVPVLSIAKSIGMNNNAIMVLSGILDEKKSVVYNAIKKCNFELIKETHQDQWVAIIVRRVD